ncbi:MAG: heme-binding protein [Ruminococcaceae bacterium]|nr:heme-binding protein [Oscillospiraceae bacterium]
MNESEIRRIVQNTISSIKPDKSQMTLALAERLCDAVIAKAKQMGVKAVVCVSDAAGNPRLVKSMDDAYIASYDVAVNKAFTVVALKMSTLELKPLAQPGESLYGIQFTNGGKIVIFGGGDPLKDGNGRIVGGLGVSGGSEAEDSALSAYGRRYFETEI